MCNKHYKSFCNLYNIGRLVFVLHDNYTAVVCLPHISFSPGETIPWSRGIDHILERRKRETTTLFLLLFVLDITLNDLVFYTPCKCSPQNVLQMTYNNNFWVSKLVFTQEKISNYNKTSTISRNRVSKTNKYQDMQDIVLTSIWWNKMHFSCKSFNIHGIWQRH